MFKVTLISLDIPTLELTGHFTLLMTKGSNYQDIWNQIKGDAKIVPPGFLQKGKTMESLTGHTIFTLSDETLSETQVS